MTEQEAGAFARRLERIWSPAKVAWRVLENGTFCFDGTLVEEPLLKMHHDDEEGAFFFLCGETQTYWLSTKDGSIEQPHFWFPAQPHGMEKQQQFAAKWLLLFRRNCWLSGYPIEASAHEKMEWVRGFKPEELEAWNLKM